MLRALALLIPVLLTPLVHSQELDPAAFAERATAALRAAGFEGRIERAEPELRFLLGGRWVIDLERCFEAYRAAAPSEREALLARHVRDALAPRSIPQTYDAAWPALIPQLRPRALVELRRLSAELEEEAPGELPAHRLLTEHLALELCVDCPRAILSVSTADLARWQVSFEKAMGQAKVNLAVRSMGELRQPFLAPLPQLFVSSWSDGNDAARMILAGLVDALAAEGDPLVFIPDPNSLIVTGTAAGPALEEAVRIAAEALKRTDDPLTGFAHRYDGERWQPYLPPRDSELYPRFRRLQLATLGRDYRDQRVLLTTVRARRGRGAVPGAFQVLERRRSGQELSFCTWTRGAHTLLPRTDLVVFVDPLQPVADGVLGAAPWERVARVMGGRWLERDELYPPRLEVKDFPDAGELKTLALEPLD